MNVNKAKIQRLSLKDCPIATLEIPCLSLNRKISVQTTLLLDVHTSLESLPYEHFWFFKGFVFKGLWPLLCYYTTALYGGFEEHLCKFHPFNPSETVGPKEAAKEDNSAPVFCIRKTCGRDRNSID